MTSISWATASALPGAAGERLVGAVEAVVVGVAVAEAVTATVGVVVGVELGEVGALLAAALELALATGALLVGVAEASGSPEGFAVPVVGALEVLLEGALNAVALASGVGGAPSPHDRLPRTSAPKMPKEPVMKRRVER